MKFGLQKMTAGNSISLIGPKFVSTLMRVGLDLYLMRNVTINAIAQTKQNIGVKAQKQRVDWFPLLSLIFLTPWIVVVDENCSQVIDRACLKIPCFSTDVFFGGVFAIAIVRLV